MQVEFRFGGCWYSTTIVSHFIQTRKISCNLLLLRAFKAVVYVLNHFDLHKGWEVAFSQGCLQGLYALFNTFFFVLRYVIN